MKKGHRKREIWGREEENIGEMNKNAKWNTDLFIKRLLQNKESLSGFGDFDETTRKLYIFVVHLYRRSW